MSDYDSMTVALFVIVSAICFAVYLVGHLLSGTDPFGRGRR